MASIIWEKTSVADAFTGSTLNSLANNGRKLGLELDNSSALYLFNDVEFHTNTFGSAPSAGAVIELYLIPIELDGAGYSEGTDSIDPPASSLVGVFNIRAVTTAQTHILRMIPIPPSKYKYLVINKTGQAMASGSNTCKYTSYRYATS